MKSLLISSFIFCMGTALNAQVSMPYATGFDNTSEQSGWQEFRKGTTSQPQAWSFVNVLSFSAPNCLLHNYPVGGTQAVDDWFVSPAFNIAGGGALDSVHYAFSGFGTPQAGDTVFIYLLNGSQDPDLAASVDILYEFSGANYQSDNTWRLLGPFNLPARPGNSYLAFRYKTINNWLDVRFDNVGVSRVSLAGIDESMAAVVEVYPNPAVNKQVRIGFDAAQLNESSLTFELYNAAGQLVHTAPAVDQQVLDLPVKPGYYIYQLQGTKGLVSKGQLMVQ